MTVQELASQFIPYMGSPDWRKGYDFYADDAVSIERPWGKDPMRMEGLDAIKAGADKWEEGLKQQHEVTISEPLIADNAFAVTMHAKVEFHGGDGIVEFKELCVYQVQDGKIVMAEYFYNSMM